MKYCLDAQAARTLINEATLLGQVAREGTHPGIVTLHYTALDSNPPGLMYELVPGGDLFCLIRQWHASNTPDLVQRAITTLHELADIVGFAHRLNPPIVHRDLKPANVLLQPLAGGQVRLRVADFGIGGLARLQQTGPTRLATMLRGACTPLYASPQQRQGLDPDPRDDVYSLGVIAFHMLTGDLTLAVTADWSHELDERQVPAQVKGLIGECLAARAERRPANAAVLAEKLAKLSLAEVKQVTSSHQQIPLVQHGEDEFVQQALAALTGVAPAHARARHLDEQHQYEEAVRVLETVPGELRDAELYGSVVGKRDRVKLLNNTIRERISAGRFFGLRATVEELLKLTPARKDLAQLLPSLPAMPKELVNSIGMKFVLIPAGKFLMGSPKDDQDATIRAGAQEPWARAEGPQHEVEITNPFYLGIYQVTQEQFQRIMGSNPSQFKGQANLPVDSVTWEEAVDFCRRLSELADEKKNGRVYRLTTEAEWEYSCRGGASEYQPFHHGKSLSSTQANFNGEYPYGGAAKGPYLQKTTPVGSYKPNAWGLFDMHGNVWEWCSDWYDANYYTESPRQNPQGPQNGNVRVLRGGSWISNGYLCRCAYRNDRDPATRFDYCGFRVVLTFA